MTVREKLSSWRMYAPPGGKQYELFDTSIYLFCIAVVAYVIFPASTGVRDALIGPLQVVSETILGSIVCLTALAGVVLSYTEHYLKLGYILPRIGASFMFINFAIPTVVLTVNGVLMLWGMDFLPKEFDLEQIFRASFVYSIVFGWAARRLSRDDAA